MEPAFLQGWAGELEQRATDHLDLKRSRGERLLERELE